ncbi:alpha/beta fold hydrolase [Salinarimonas chemoclinalis]|uniref:alpha/beta fold hydrolase n=1 Tax=Salinarimonas chemoclinalis TaxID=3241599 RepID=UPI00355670F2
MRRSLVLAALALASIAAPAGAQEPADTVVFLHSLAGTPALWSAQIDALPAGVVGVAPAWPVGAGAPPATIEAIAAGVAADLAAGGVSTYVLAGHSAGGSVALALAAANPEAVRGLFLVNTPGDLREIPADFLRGFVASLREGDYEASLRAYWEALLTGSAEGTAAPVLEAALAAPPEIVPGVLDALLAFDPMAALAAYGGPVRILTGPDNEASFSLHVLDPTLDATFVPDVSHYVQLDRPDVVSAALRDFLADLNGGE